MDKLKILVVDDESRMRKLVRDFLVKQNFEVLEAGDGAEALDIFFGTEGIALVILDVMMPKMDGWQTCREIRAYSKVPIIMLTAKSDERDELQGFDLGVDEYISKPFSPKILVARVEAILRRTSARGADEVLDAGGISLDKAAHIVTVGLTEEARTMSMLSPVARMERPSRVPRNSTSNTPARITTAPASSASYHCPPIPVCWNRVKMVAVFRRLTLALHFITIRLMV